MINLSVNVNKIATLRNARGGNTPDVQQVAMDCERFGADGITVHPRPDERHIRRSDVYALRPLVRTEFNIEGYPSEQFMELVLSVRPTQATLVPDAPGVLTSSAGWEIEPNMEFLCGIVDRLKEAGIRTSIFVGTDLDNIRAAARTGADHIELYTGPQYDVRENTITALNLVQEAEKRISHYRNFDNLGVEEYDHMTDLLLEAKENLLDVLVLCREIELEGNRLARKLDAQKHEQPQDPQA